MKKIITLVFFIVLISNAYSGNNDEQNSSDPLVQGNGCENKESVIIGDVHGDLQALTEILQDKGIITPKGELNKSSDKCLVVMGDMIDRGSYSIETYFFLRSLKLQDRDRVTLLLGNHEVNVLTETEGLTKINSGFNWIKDYGYEKFRNILISDVKDDLFQASHFLGDNKNPILLTHAGLSPQFYKLFEEVCKKSRPFTDKKNISLCINEALKEIDFSKKGFSENLTEFQRDFIGLPSESSISYKLSPFFYTTVEDKSKEKGYTEYSDKVNHIKGHQRSEKLDIEQRPTKEGASTQVYFIDVGLSKVYRENHGRRLEHNNNRRTNGISLLGQLGASSKRIYGNDYKFLTFLKDREELLKKDMYTSKKDTDFDIKIFTSIINDLKDGISKNLKGETLEKTLQTLDDLNEENLKRLQTLDNLNEETSKMLQILGNLNEETLKTILTLDNLKKDQKAYISEYFTNFKNQINDDGLIKKLKEINREEDLCSVACLPKSKDRGKQICSTFGIDLPKDYWMKKLLQHNSTIEELLGIAEAQLKAQLKKDAGIDLDFMVEPYYKRVKIKGEEKKIQAFTGKDILRDIVLTKEIKPDLGLKLIKFHIEKGRVSVEDVENLFNRKIEDFNNIMMDKEQALYE